MLVQFFYEYASENARMQSSSLKNSTVAWRRTPSHPYHPINRKRITRSSTPDVLETSLSIYQFKSALSRKSAPPPHCLHIVPASLTISIQPYNWKMNDRVLNSNDLLSIFRWKAFPTAFWNIFHSLGHFLVRGNRSVTPSGLSKACFKMIYDDHDYTGCPKNAHNN
jgi:hypothetical protein